MVVKNTDKNNLAKIVSVFNSGGIVVFPTDTAYGIGCRIDYPGSVDKLFRIRKRPLSRATPVLVASIPMALDYFSGPSETVKALMQKFWPGALTIVAKARADKIYSPIRGYGENIGLRVPAYDLIRQAIGLLGVPIIGTSANIHGSKTPFTDSDIDPEIRRKADMVIPGSCPLGQESTVVDCSVHPYRILRQGAVRL